ncbi:MAG: hypothetical protein H7A46_25685 [Verrucomicrobiales bacterium]|nr:hypothetical protein [Verrucomicrobiales bacterium]
MRIPRRSRLFWERVAAIPRLTAPWPVWRQVGTGLEQLKPYLRQTGEVAGHLYCERCGCSHRIVPGLRDGWVAVCNCGCEDLPVQETDRILHELDFGRLLNRVGEMFPLQVRPERLGGSAAWLVGCGTRRNDGQSVNLITCPSDRSTVITPAATAVLRADTTPCLFASQSGRLSDIESLLPPGSRACLLADVIEVGKGYFQPGTLARQYLTGWQDDAPAEARGGRPSGTLEVRGYKNSRLSGRPYRLRLWRCWFEDRCFDLPDVLGSELLVRVLTANGEEIHADRLRFEIEGESENVADERTARDVTGPPDGASGSIRRQVDTHQPIIDDKTLHEFRVSIAKLQQDIKECGEDPALQKERAELEEELETQLGFLDSCTRPGPGGRRIPKAFPSSLTAAANLVGKHFRKVLQALEEVDKGFWQHLIRPGALTFGRVCRYGARDGPRWRNFG